MNNYQKGVICFTVFLLLLMGLFPPWHAQVPFGVSSAKYMNVNLGYSFLLSPPNYKHTQITGDIAFARLLLQWISSLILGVVVFFIARFNPRQQLQSGVTTKHNIQTERDPITTGATLHQKDPEPSDPQTPTETITIEQNVTRFRPWIRFWARHFDLAIFTLLISIFGYLLFPNVFWNRNIIILGIVITFLSFIVDGTVRYLFGNTPGKALLNTKIVKEDGTKIELSKSIERSTNVWLFAFAAGLPLISFFTQYYAFKSARKNNGKGFWDNYTKTKVVHGSISKLNAVFFIFMLISLYSALSLSSMELLADKDKLQKYKATAQQRQSTPLLTTQIDPSPTLPSKPSSQLNEEEIRSEHASAQALFKKLYPDVFADQTLLAEANKRYYAKLDQGKTITEAMLEAGKETQDHNRATRQ